ncbi:hypothetical protein N7512_010483 [Penicillium capsulatum]|nr:hypothetical protein N7512_010483 [Penicillium capsulatum]
MPKRKAPTKISGLMGSDDDELMQMSGNEASQEPREEPPSKKPRGRPRTSHENATEAKKTAPAKKAGTAASRTEPQKRAPRGRPRGSSRTSDDAGNARASASREPGVDNTHEEELKDTSNSKGSKNTRVTDTTRTTATRARGRGRAASNTMQLQTDGEFEYTPTSARQATAEGASEDDAEPSPRPRAAQRRNHEAEVAESQHIEPAAEVEESIFPDDHSGTRHTLASALKNARSRLSVLRNSQDPSPRKRKSGVETDQGGDPELRRRIGDITKKHDALESKYRSLREIGIVEANTNMDKLHPRLMGHQASNELVSSLRSELEAQRTLGNQSRGLQKQLKERDAEMAQLKSEADEARSQLASSQSEVKALQTKLAAARNTAASLETAAKVPGSAIKGGPANRATAAATAEAAQVAQLAQLKEDLYCDLTGLIVRDVKNRESDQLYDCIQTGVNGTLHFKLSVPKVSSAEYDSAEFQYLPLLDANRDRDLVNILPDFLTVDITFNRQQASKFYTRVIDALTKRRSSTT